MPLGPLAIAGITAGASALTNLVGQGIQNKKNLELAKYQYKKDLEMWNMQNLYNSPSEQMERLRQAGLNPNLVYGTGAVGNTSSPSPKFESPEFKLDTGHMVPDAMPVLQAHQNIKMQKAQTDNIEALTLNTQTENTNKLIQQEIMKKEAELKGVDLEQLRAMNPLLQQKLTQDIESQGLDIQLKTETLPYQADILKETARRAPAETEQAFQQLGITAQRSQQMAQELKNAQTQNEIQKQEQLLKKYEAEWMQSGVTKTDNLGFRVIAKYLEDKNITSPEQIKEVIKSKATKEILRVLNYTPDWMKKSDSLRRAGYNPIYNK